MKTFIPTSTLRCVLAAVFLFAGTSLLMAQSRHYNAASLGMGSGGTAYVDGYHANFINPANLMLQRHNRPRRTLGILGGVGIKAGGSLVNIAVYNKYLTKGLTIEGQTRVDLLNDWFGSDSENTRQFSGSVNVVPFGISTRSDKSAFSLAVRTRVIDDFTVNRGFAELYFYGLDKQHFSSPVPVDFSNSTIVYNEISLGYARQIMSVPDLLFAKDIKVYAGVAPKYIIGANANSLSLESTLQIQDVQSSGSGTTGGIIHRFSYTATTYGELSTQLEAFERARESDPDAKFEDYVDYDGSDSGQMGSGFGLDAGITATMDVSHTLPFLNFFGKKKTLNVSMSVTDLGSVSYDDNPQQVYANGTFRYTGAVGNEDVEDYFDNLSDSLQNDIYGDFDTRDIDNQSYDLPGMYNFGAALTMGKTTVAADYGVGFNDTGVNSERSVLNLGLEHRFLGFVPLRVGTRIGGYTAQAYSAGLGIDLRFFEFSVAASVVENSENDGAALGVAMGGLLFRF